RVPRSPAANRGRAAPAAPPEPTRHTQKAGTGSYKPLPNGTGDPAAISSEIPKAFGPEAHDGEDAAAAATARGSNATGTNRSQSLTHGAKGANRAAAGSVTSAAAPNSVVRNGPRVMQSFDGINHRQQRLT